MYSQIPMPRIQWREEDTEYALCFFPLVGAVIGGLLCLWHAVCARLGIGILCYTLVGGAIPLLVTGGFHVDGFMDSVDAFRSYQPREKKRAIMKDVHVGAFSVIELAVFGLLYLGAFSEIRGGRGLQVFAAGFFLSRCLSGISVLTFSLAPLGIMSQNEIMPENGTMPKNETSLNTLKKGNKKITLTALIAEAFFCIAFMLIRSWRAGLAVTAAALCVFVYYYFHTKKEIGGITGDTAGYFVVLCEGGMAVAAALACVIMEVV